jgi:hypothetical protein
MMHYSPNTIFAVIYWNLDDDFTFFAEVVDCCGGDCVRSEFKGKEFFKV